jgi:hypothetical protein
MSLWALRIFFLSLCTVGGYAVSQVRPELIHHGGYGVAVGFGLGGLLIAIDEMLKGFSLRAFSAASFGLLLGSVIAWLIDASGLFDYVQENTRWIIRLTLFLSFGYIGIVLAMRSNKEDFYLIIPFVRFASQSKPETLLLLDTSAIIDGRVADLLEGNFLDGTAVVPRFVLQELQRVADSADPSRRARGRRGLDVLSRLQRHPRVEVKIHEADIPEETAVDAKLVRPAGRPLPQCGRTGASRAHAAGAGRHAGSAAGARRQRKGPGRRLPRRWHDGRREPRPAAHRTAGRRAGAQPPPDWRGRHRLRGTQAGRLALEVGRRPCHRRP